MDLDCLPHTFLSDCTNTRVFRVQTGDKGDGLAVEVRLVMEGTLRKYRPLTRVKDVGDKPNAVFLDETDFKV